MAGPIWRGSLNFGLVTVPVALYSATSDHTVHFRQMVRDTGDRVRYRRINERTGEEVDYGDIAKGYELEDGSHVLVESEELEEIAPGRSRTIDIESFVSLREIDPIYFQRSYWLAPSNTDFARAYGLLVEAMDRSERAGVATFVMRNREYVATIRASQGVLALDTLLFAEDVRSPEDAMGSLPELPRARGQEIDMAEQLIESMSDEWQPQRYHDTYSERVRELIANKEAGRGTTPAEQPEEPTKVVDLFDALSASVRGRSGSGNGNTRGRKRWGDKSTRGTRKDLSELSKADLDELARQQGIRGRSKMSREQLEQALRDASEGRKVG